MSITNPVLVPQGPQFVKPANLIFAAALLVVQATNADIAFSKGILGMTGGFSQPINNAQTTAFEVVPYSAPQAQVGALLMSGITVADGVQYTIQIMTLANNQTYSSSIISNTGSTVASIIAQFVSAINNNFSWPVSATGTATTIILSEDSPNTGGFQVVAPTGAVYQIATILTLGAITGTYTPGETVTQATSTATGTLLSITLSPNIAIVYNTTGTFDTSHVVTGGSSGATSTPSAVASNGNNIGSGTPAEVAVMTSNPSITTGQFRKYVFQCNNSTPNSGISGLLAAQTLKFYYVDETATNFAAFDTALKTIPAGTWSPSTAYLGI